MNNDINFQRGNNPDDDDGDGLNGFNNLNDISDLNNAVDNEDEFGAANNFAAGNNAEDDDTAATKDEIDEAVKKNRFKIDQFSISGIWKAIKDYWLGLQKKTRIFAVSSAAGLLVFIVVLAVILNQSPYVKTFNDIATDKEALEIANILDANKIKYKYDVTQMVISVKEKDMAKAAMVASQRGYPESGFLFDFEEEQSTNMLETQQEKKDRDLRNRQKRLEAALGLMTGIDGAVVNLNIPDNSRSAITREILPSSASVQLITTTGYNISQDTVRGIENMIQKSVENLAIEDITIINQNGVILNDYSISDTTDFTSVVEIQAVFDKNEEKSMYNKLRELLTPVYGIDGFSLSCDIESDFDDLVREAKYYDGANVDDNGMKSGITAAIAGDRSLGHETDSSIIGQAVPELNPDSDGYYETPGDTESEGNWYDDNHYTDERLVDSVLEQMKRTTPDIINKSVTVYVDTTLFDTDMEDEWIVSLGMAVGINNLAKNDLPEDETLLDASYFRNYVSIVPVAFNRATDYKETAPVSDIFGFKPIQLLLALATAFIVIIILTMIIIAVMNRRREEREEAIAREEALLAGNVTAAAMPGLTPFGLAAGRYAAAAETDDEDEEEVDELVPIETREQALKKQIKTFAEQNPEIAAQLVKTLLKGDESHA